MKVRDGEWFTGWVRCLQNLVRWAATEAGGRKGKLVVDGGLQQSFWASVSPTEVWIAHVDKHYHDQVLGLS